MNNGVKYALAFVAGAATGVFVVWRLFETRYKQIVAEETESIREYYATKPKESDDEKGAEKPHAQVNKPIAKVGDVKSSSYPERLAQLGYMNYSDVPEAPKAKNEEVVIRDENSPYIIAPEEFGECGYKTVELTYYADEVLTDELDEPITDVTGVLGLNPLHHFGEYEDDSVFVRDDNTETDYQILRDPRDYSEVMSTGPRRAEDE